MQNTLANKYGVGALVRLLNNRTLVWKVVEVWDISYIAAITNRIEKSNQYVITNVVTMDSKVVPEADITPINVENGVEVSVEEESKKTKKSK